MPVDYSIHPDALVEFIKTTLLTPVQKLVKGFPWDFSTMVSCETGGWQDVMKTDHNIPYFQG